MITHSDERVPNLEGLTNKEFNQHLRNEELLSLFQHSADTRGDESVESNISLIFDWADAHRDINFDTSFVKSVQNWCYEREATHAQELALDNIINRWHMRSWERKEKGL